MNCAFKENVLKVSEEKKLWQGVELEEVGKLEEFCFHSLSSFSLCSSCLYFMATETSQLVSFFLDFVFEQLVINGSNVSGNFKLRVVYSAHVWLNLVALPPLCLVLPFIKALL